jgi:hypothetical protein
LKFSLSYLHAYPAPIRLLAFTLILLLIWMPIAVPAYLFIGDRNLINILTLTVLYVEFLWLVQVWGKQVHRRSSILWHYGLEFSRRIGQELLLGLGIGLASLILLAVLESVAGWVLWHAPSGSFVRTILEGLLVSLAVGFAEELVFRGWMLDELQQDYSPPVVLWVDAVLFALLHLRLILFPALFFLGVALVWAKRSFFDRRLGRRRDRLGLPIGLHAGLVWGNYLLEVGKLISYTDRVPAWVTGIDRNPLAGLVGILFLAGLAVAMWQFARQRTGAVRFG